MMKQQRKQYAWGIFRLWVNWLIGSGALTLLIILSLWIRPLILPFVAFAMQFGLFLLTRHNRKRRIPSCYILPFVVMTVLFWTCIVMILINILYSTSLLDLVFDRSKSNEEIPFITTLISMPIAAVVSGWGYIRREKMSFCRDCMIRNGSPAERGFLGLIFTQIGTYQVGMLFWISSVSSIVGWIYYAFVYVNVSLSIPDRFFFFWFPTLLWIASAIYLAIRYAGIFEYYRQDIEGSLQRHGKSSLLRYIMICDNTIAIRPPETDSDFKITLDEKIDTPIQIYVHRMEDVTDHVAEQYFSNLSGINGVEIRKIYQNFQASFDRNVFHFFAFFTEEQREKYQQQRPETIWIPLTEVANMINERLCNPMLSAEIIRIVTIARAFKTYDDNGRRRYKVKHYRPAVAIKDFHDLDVDYAQPKWLYIADNNQDRSFFRFRRFWRNNISGLGQN